MASLKLFVVTMDGGMGRDPVIPKVNDAMSESADWAEDVVTASSMANLLATVGILLIRERENVKSSSDKLLVSSSHKIKLAVP